MKHLSIIAVFILLVSCAHKKHIPVQSNGFMECATSWLFPYEVKASLCLPDYHSDEFVNKHELDQVFIKPTNNKSYPLSVFLKENQNYTEYFSVLTLRGGFLPKETKEILGNNYKELLENAQKGFAPAQYVVGMHYWYNIMPDCQDYSKAIRWLKASAKGGFIPASYELAEMYNDKSDKQHYNKTRALYWFTRAAHHGIEPAMQEKNKLLKERREY